MSDKEPKMKKLCSGCFDIWLPWADHPVFCCSCLSKVEIDPVQKVLDSNDYRSRMKEGRITQETKDKLAALSIGWEQLGESNKRQGD